jgi:16S rRNA (cytosine967-C5)-methyltransferase
VPAPPYPDHTLVDQAVTAARQRTPAAAGFINAVLRRFVRERDALVAAVERTPIGAYNHPAWWIERLRQDWPTQWQALLHSANERPPMTLRVNARRCTGADYVHRLAAAGRAATLLDDPALAGRPWCWPSPARCSSCPASPTATCRCRTPRRSAPRAWCWAMGPTACPPAPACWTPAPRPAARPRSCWSGRPGPAGAGQRPEAHPPHPRNAGPAAPEGPGAGGRRRDTAHWWDGRPFDAILLDAPCSASGIVRRHPDIRWLRRPDDLSALARVQSELLQALWPLLRPGGRLVYATCSIFKAEGAQRIDAFLQRMPPGGADLDPASPGHLLPLADNPIPGRCPHPRCGAGRLLLRTDPQALTPAPSTMHHRRPLDRRQLLGLGAAGLALACLGLPTGCARRRSNCCRCRPSAPTAPCLWSSPLA